MSDEVQDVREEEHNSDDRLPNRLGIMDDARVEGSYHVSCLRHGFGETERAICTYAHYHAIWVKIEKLVRPFEFGLSAMFNLDGNGRLGMREALTLTACEAFTYVG